MSLSSVLARPDVRRQFAAVIQLPASVETTYGRLDVRSCTGHPSLVGSAFDYLMRFRIQFLNPHCICRPWVADAAIRYTQSRKDAADSRERSNWIETAARVANALACCRDQHRRFLESGTLTEGLLESVFLLAQIDHFVRNKADFFCPLESRRAQEELAAMYEIIPAHYFAPRKECVLNPTFGAGSSLVGGADADLLLDQTLVEIKTTTALKATAKVFEQLVAYLALAEIGGVDGQREVQPIVSIGVYAARYGCYHAWCVGDIIAHNDLRRLASWLRIHAGER
jgi:hypothetical protein